MTVIAALELEGVPVLIGDFLITDKRDVRSLQLHTRPDFPLPPMTHRVADLRRKCILINDHFVVGFTGSVPSGKRMIQELVSRFSKLKRGPTHEEIDKALHHFTMANAFDTIIGWTIHNRRPVCFSFTARLGEKVKKVNRAIAGSGAHSFKKFLGDAFGEAYSASIKTAAQRAALRAIVVIGRTITEEMYNGQPLIEGFGGGAEVAIWNGLRFEFVPKIGFLFWNVTLNAAHEISVEPSRLTAVYENKGRHALFAMFSQRGIRKMSPNDILTETTACYLAGLLPLHEDFPLGLGKADEPDLRSPFYFAGFGLSVRPDIPPILMSLACSATDNTLFSIQADGGIGTSLNKREVEAMVRNLVPEARWH